MAEVKETLVRTSRANNNSGTLPITDILFMTLHHWPWILLSIFICVGAAYFHLLRTPDVYTRAAEIQIKDDSKGNSSSPIEFADMGLFQSNTNSQNEMINLKSTDLMEEVVKRLDLDTDYFIPGRFHNKVAYGFDLPVTVEVADFPPEDSYSLKLQVAADGTVTIDDLASAGAEPSSKKYVGKLNEGIPTPIGNVTVTPTDAYVKGSGVSLIVNKVPVMAATNSYNARLGVNITNDKGSVLRLTLSDQSVQRADDVLATVINVYNENWIRDKNQVAVSTSNFINERLAVIERELGDVDSDISSYKSQNLIPNFEAAASMYMGQNQQYQSEIFGLNTQISMARYVKNYLAVDANRNQLLPSNASLIGGAVEGLISTYNNLMLQRNALANKSSETNPLVKELDEQLAAQRKVILGSIDNEITALETHLRAIKDQEAETVSKLASSPNKAKDLLSIERQQKVKESLYLFLLQKREENELSQAFTAYNTRLVNRPRSAGVPPTPNRGNILTIAFLVGLAIPFAFVYVKETFNTKVRGRKDVENLPVPFLGEIPQYGGNRKKKGAFGKEVEQKAIVVKPGKRDIINEAFRVLRTNLEFMKTNKEGVDVIAMTSFNPGSGKSFLTMNLAITLALKDKRVLVIDGDMRHGSTSSYIDSPETGLSDYLSGSVADANSIIVTDKDRPTLHIIPIGTVPPNPTELLESPRFAKLISELKPRYDYIIIDCPPIEVVADAQIIDNLADRTIFVVRAGLLERSMLPQLEKIYVEKKFKNVAYILNGTRNDQGRYGYSHSYRYGYGYGYGYGYNYGGKSSSSKSKTRENKWMND